MYIITTYMSVYSAVRAHPCLGLLAECRARVSEREHAHTYCAGSVHFAGITYNSWIMIIYR